MSTAGKGGKALRAGVVGLGWAGQQHLAAYASLPGVEVVALAAQEAPTLQRLAEEHHVPRTYERWEDIVAEGGIDVLSVATPPYLHAPVVVAALEAGMHVLTEKPIARNGDEAERMVEAAKKADRVLQVAFNHRYRGDVSALKRYVDEGKLGHVYYAKARWLRRSGVPGPGWFTSRELAGGGPLMDLGVHALDWALYLLGEPQVLAVSASTHAELGARRKGGPPRSGVRPRPFDVEDTAVAFMRLAGGTTLVLETTWVAHMGQADRFGVSLFGTEAGAEIEVVDYAETGTLRIYTDIAGVPAEIRPVPAPSGGHLAVVRAFLGAVQGGHWEGQHAEDALVRARVIDACYLSASQGREVPVVEDL